MGDNEVELRFENMSVGADYRVYFSYSGNGFNSYSDYHYFTYDGTPMELVLPVTAWACSISYSWNVNLYDFRYQHGHNYNSWHLGSDSGSMDGPCESMSYDSSSRGLQHKRRRHYFRTASGSPRPQPPDRFLLHGVQGLLRRLPEHNGMDTWFAENNTNEHSFASTSQDLCDVSDTPDSTQNIKRQHH